MWPAKRLPNSEGFRTTRVAALPVLQRLGRPKPIVRIAAYLLHLDNAFVLDLWELSPTFCGV
jgi:hypothetical protein